MDLHYMDQLRCQREELEKVPWNFYLKERDLRVMATSRAACIACRCSREECV